MLSRLVRVPSF